MSLSERVMTAGTDEYDALRWHDNIIYALHLDAADPDRGVWRSDLVLDIDHIVEWICGTDGSVQFRIAPATLVFHDVTDLRITIDFGRSGFRCALNELSIGAIAREPTPCKARRGHFLIFSGESSSIYRRGEKSHLARAVSRKPCAPSRICARSKGSPQASGLI
jgi:hypothetical protein